MNKETILKIIPYVVSIALFYIVTTVYFSPEFFENKVIRQDDIDKYYGMVKEITDHQEKTDEVSMWSGRMFGGMPAYLFRPYFPDFPISFIDEVLTGFLPRGTNMSYTLFLAMMCPFILLLSFRVHPYLAAAGGIAFALTTYNLILIDVGHITKMWAISYASLVLAGMRLTFRGNRLLGFALTALGMSLELRAYHLQITYYLAFICVIYAISEAVFAFKKKDLIPTLIHGGILLFAVVLGVGVSAGKLMTTLEYSTYSTRGTSELTPIDNRGQGETGLDKDYAFSWSQGKMETLTLLVPYLYGGSSGEALDTNSEAYQQLRKASRSGQLPADFFNYATKNARLYWGDQPFTSGPIYAGAVVCFLFVLGLVLVESRVKYWILAGVILTVMIAWGENLAFFNYAMFDYFPGFNKFRTVSMALSLTILLMTLLGMLGAQEVLKREFDQDLLKKIGIALAATAGVALVIALASFSMDTSTPTDGQFGFVGEIWQAERQRLMRNDALRAAFIILLAAGAIYYKLKEKISATVAMLIISTVMVGDLWLVGKRYLNNDSFERAKQAKPYQATPADEFILKDGDLGYRVITLGNPFQETQTSYFHCSVGGYFAVKMRRYQDLIERQLAGEEKSIIDDFGKGRPNFENYKALNMLNTRYIKFGTSEREVIQNPLAMGAAWFVQDVQEVKSADEEIATLAKANLRTTAIVNTSKYSLGANKFETDSTQYIRLMDYNPMQLTYQYESKTDAFAVFSEIYYPKGWNVTLDGQPATHLNANYVLRGMELPKGKHELVFRFEPESYSKGALITQVSAYLVGLLVLIAFALVLKDSFLKGS